MGDRPDTELTPSLTATLADVANVLLLEPADKPAGEAVCFDLLTADPPDERFLLVVSAGWSPDEWYETWRRRVGEERPAGVGFVTVGEEARSAAAEAREPVAVHPTMMVQPVASPGALTKIGVAVSELFTQWGDGQSIVLCVRSLAPLIEATDLQRTYRFLHVLISQVQTSGAVGHYHLDPAAVDAGTLKTLTTLFDAVVERDPDGGWQVRGA